MGFPIHAVAGASIARHSQREGIVELAKPFGRVMALAAGFVLRSLHGFAWGGDGHQIIAHIAARELTPAARAQVEQLLGGNADDALAAASTWADEVRPQRPATAPWHFVNIPLESSGYSAARDCRRDDCVVAQIERDEGILADKSLLPPVRAEALRFLIHFIGDVHQPLHAADDGDRGGNQLSVVLGRRRTNTLLRHTGVAEVEARTSARASHARSAPRWRNPRLRTR